MLTQGTKGRLGLLGKVPLTMLDNLSSGQPDPEFPRKLD